MATRKRKATLKGIPTKIWQTWKSKELAPRIVPYVESWKANTDYEYSYNDDEDCKSFIDSLDDQDIKVCYDKMPLPVMKADLWRYLIVYTHGGVYADVDTTCNTKVSEWIPKGANLVLCIEDNKSLFCQWTFAAEVNHPALKQVIDDVLVACKGYINMNDPHIVHSTTGPSIFTVSMLKYMSKLIGRELTSSHDALLSHDELAAHGVYIYDEHFFKTGVVSHLYASQWNNDKNYTSWHSDRNKFKTSSVEEAFSNIYANALWAGGNMPLSGPGSSVDYCRQLGSFLCSYLTGLGNIGTMCDLGCGDMTWIGDLVVNPLGIKYVGVDCVGSLISRHTEHFKANPNYSFWHLEFSHLSRFPKADIYFIKDVLQHWESDTVYNWLNSFFSSNPSSKIILVNCNYQSGPRQLSVGGFYPLNKDYYPLIAFDCEHLMSWDSKSVYLVTARTADKVSPPIEHLAVHSTEYNKIRVGRDGDGGYVIADAGGYDKLLSAGVGDDVSFEHHLLDIHKNLMCDSFDGTVNGLPKAHDRITFNKVNIGSGQYCTNLHSEISQYSNIFLKMDIEGGEYEFFRDITDDLMSRIKQIVLEVHGTDSANAGELFSKLTKTHTLIHIHVNNYAGTCYMNGVEVPSVVECTYLRTDCISDKRYSTESLPSNLDKPCSLSKPDITKLSRYPFIR